MTEREERTPQEMTIEELRAELRHMGVTDRLATLIAREMEATEERARRARGAAGFDPLKAQLHILKAYGMTTPDLALNRKGVLFVTLTTLLAHAADAA